MRTTPWDERLLGLTIPQIDLMIKLYVEDHPTEMKIVPINDIKEGKLAPQIMEQWYSVIRGPEQINVILKPGPFFKKHYGVDYNEIGKNED